MIKFLRDKSSHIIFICVLLIQIIFMIFYCDMKKGYFVDELWSYGLSNSYYHAQIWEDGALDNPEISPDMFKEYMTVNEGEAFKFGSVIYNQTHDSHPPLFYMVLHAISSCFPGQFSKWFGLIPNLLYYAVTIIFLYKIGKLIKKDNYFAFFPVLFFGFSIAAVNMVTYIRMYMLLTMWCTIFAYEHLEMMASRKIKMKNLISILLATFGGVFTHYYFVIFAFPMVIFQMIWMIMRKDFKMTGKYVVSGGVGGVCAVALYPAILKNLTGTGVSHSQKTLQNMHNFSDWTSRIRKFWVIVSEEMFGGVFMLLLIVCCLGILAYLITQVLWEMKLQYHADHYEIAVNNKEHTKTVYVKVKRETYLICDIILICAFVFVISAKISPWQVNRYIMNLFPFLSLLFCYLLYFIYKLWIKNKAKIQIAMVISMMLIGGLTYYVNDPCYLYPEGENNIAISKEYTDTTCLYVYTTSYIMINEGLELQNYQRLYQMYYKDLDIKVPDVSIENSKLVVYLDRILDKKYDDLGEKVTMDPEKCLEKIQKLTGLKNSKELYQDEKAYVYELYN